MNRKELLVVSKATINEFVLDDVGLLAAGLTYYVFFSIFPLLLLSVTLAGLMVKPEDARNFIFTRVAEVVPGSTTLLSSALDKAVENRSNAGWLALIGLVTLLFSASSAFSTLYKAINRAWGTEHRPGIILERLISFIMMVAVAVLLMASVLISAVLTSVRSFTQWRLGHVPGDQIFWQVVTIAVSFGLTFVVLLVIYRILPRTKVTFRDIWLGALVAAVAWTAVKELFALYLGSSLQNYDAIYGTMGAVIALLTWIYISSLIILTGAEFASEITRARRLRALGIEQKEPGKQTKDESPWFA